MRSSGRTFIIRMVFFVMALSLSSVVARADEDSKAKIEQIIAACNNQQRRDRICQAFVDLRQVGDDALEAVKLYARLSPQEYAILTLANMIATGRFRFRTRSQIFREGRDIYDIRRDGVTYIFELDF